jgi:hypothetical protein
MPGEYGQEVSGPWDIEVNRKGMGRVVEEGIEAGQVADTVFEAIRNDQFYILTHPHYGCMVRARMEDIVHGRNPANPWEALLALE